MQDVEPAFSLFWLHKTKVNGEREVNKPKVNKPSLVSKAAYARHRGCARSAVTKAIQEGRISTVGDLIDPVQADREWIENTKARGDSSGGTRRGRLPDQDPPAPGDGAAAGPIYSTARARREQTEARIAEIDLAKLEGELLDRATVERAAFTLARTVRDRVMGLPVRVAPLLAPITDAFEVETKLRNAIREALNECLGDLGVAR